MNLFKQVYLLITALLLVSFPGTVFGQMFTGGLTAVPSDLFQILAEKKTANPKMSATELSDLANELLNKKGINHQIELDSQTCAVIAEKRKTLKAGSNTVGGRIKLMPKEGSVTNVFIPNFEVSSCGKCFAPLPLLAVTDKEMMTIIQGQNVGFLRAPNLVVNEALLIDQKNAEKVLRRWAIPARAVPLGLSDDGLWLYIGVPDKNFDELALMIYETGVIQFAPRTTLDLRASGVEPKNLIGLKDNSTKFLTFGTGEDAKIIKFSAPCNL